MVLEIGDYSVPEEIAFKGGEVGFVILEKLSDLTIVPVQV
jgi:hypothetical protein